MRPNDRRQQLSDLIEDVPWGDVEGNLETIQESLRIAILATQEDFTLWLETGEHRYGDEFSLSTAQVAALDQETRLALVARLVRDIALACGVATEATQGARLGQLNDRGRDRTRVGLLIHELLELAPRHGA